MHETHHIVGVLVYGLCRKRSSRDCVRKREWERGKQKSEKKETSIYVLAHEMNLNEAKKDSSSAKEILKMLIEISLLCASSSCCI